MSFEVTEIGKNDRGQPLYMVVRYRDEGLHRSVMNYEITADDIEGAKFRLSQEKLTTPQNIFNTAGLYRGKSDDSDKQQ